MKAWMTSRRGDSQWDRCLEWRPWPSNLERSSKRGGVWNGDRLRAHWSQRSWGVKGKRVSFESLSKKTLRLCHSYGLDCIPQNVYWSPNPCYLRRWIYLKMSSLQLQLVQVMPQKCWAPITWSGVACWRMRQSQTGVDSGVSHGLLEAAWAKLWSPRFVCS